MHESHPINQTLVQNAKNLGAEIIKIDDDHLEALLPSNLSRMALFQATQFLCRAVPRGMVMQETEVPEGILFAIQQT